MTDLPVLAEDPSVAGIDGGYPLRYLAHHLCHAGRTADLHALLAIEHPGAGGHLVNTWFAAHDHADSIISYLDDLARARSDAVTATDQYITRGQAAASLGTEVRYALMAASIASYTANISTDLLGQLVRTGMWSSQRGLDHARRIADPERQLEALLVVCGNVNDEEQPAVLAQALTAATAIRGDSARARALTGLAPHLPPDLLAQALTAATAIPDDDVRAQALTRAGAAPARRPAASRAGPGAHRRHHHPRRLRPRPGADRAGAAPALRPCSSQALTAARRYRLATPPAPGVDRSWRRTCLAAPARAQALTAAAAIPTTTSAPRR